MVLIYRMSNKMIFQEGKQELKAILLSLITGFIVGAIFKILKLPIPAPNALAGVVGIFGIFLGAFVIEQLLKLFTK